MFMTSKIKKHLSWDELGMIIAGESCWMLGSIGMNNRIQ